MRERLLDDVQARLERFQASRDLAVVLAPEALAEVSALLETAPDPGADLQVAFMAGLLYWFRSLATDPGDDRQDLTAALRLLAPVYRAAPHLVPGAVRLHFDANGPDVPANMGVTAGRGARLLESALRTGNSAELNEAIASLRQALAATPPAHPGRAGLLSNLSVALRTRFEQTGALADLDEAVRAGQEAVEATPSGDSHRAGSLSNLSAALQTRFTRTGALADLNEAIRIGREAVEATPPGHPDRAAALVNLGAAVQTRFERTGALADLNEAIRIGREAVEATPPGHPGRATTLSNLGVAVWLRFERTGAPGDLDETVRTGREALAASLPDDPGRAATLSNLGMALHTRFERTGALADLNEAISIKRKAVEAAPPGHSHRAGTLVNLAATLHTRFEQTGTLADLDETLAALREARELTPPGHPGRARVLSNLGLALQARFERTEELADLDEAVRTLREALELTPPGHPDRARRQSLLGPALRMRFARTGTLADLDEAITAEQEALQAAPTGHPDRARWMSNLGVALQARFERMGALADLDEAITITREAAEATPADHPDQATLLTNLGASLQARYERTGALADLDEAIAAFQRAVAVEVASPRARARAARGWGRLAGAAGRWEEAVAGFEAAVGLLGRVAPRSLVRRDQEHLLEDFGGLAAEAAACCVLAGLTDRAVELFEQGQGVLLGQALDTRSDLTAVAERHPDLAERFIALRDDLDRSSGPDGHPDGLAAGTAGSAGSRAGASVEVGRRHQIAEAFDQVIGEIRAKQGFAGFLRPLPVSDLAAAAAGGPVVVVTVSRFGSYALILTSGGVLEPVPLEDLTPERVADQVAGFLTALDDVSASSPAEGQLTAVLGWLWDAIADPVLARLGLSATPVGDSWPRLWWCVPGFLSFLPVHAAGHHHTRFDAIPKTVADRAVSSYTPTIRALIHARHTRPADGADVTTGGRDVVVVAMPHTPGASDLPGAEAEADLLRRRFRDRAATFIGSEATHDAVVGALPRARWAHFACHGYADITSPSASYLLLTDHQERPLTVVDVARLRLDQADLAFLSACSTARPGGRLADEAIHLGSAFQLAGYRQVIGTLWPISDQNAVELADDLYTAVASTATVDTAAIALHTVTRRLRNRWVRMPSVWASHIHSGI